MAKMTGRSGYVKKIKEGGPEVVKRVGAALYTAGDMVAADASTSLTTGSQGGKNHRPSAPGSPPNNDSGILAGSIQVIQDKPLRVKVVADAPYAAIQEYGGVVQHPGGTAYFIGDDGLAVFVESSDPRAASLPRTKPHEIVLPARPFMRPALDKNRDAINQLISKAVKLALKDAGNGT